MSLAKNATPASSYLSPAARIRRDNHQEDERVYDEYLSDKPNAAAKSNRATGPDTETKGKIIGLLTKGTFLQALDETQFAPEDFGYQALHEAELAPEDFGYQAFTAEQIADLGYVATVSLINSGQKINEDTVQRKLVQILRAYQETLLRAVSTLTHGQEQDLESAPADIVLRARSFLERCIVQNRRTVPFNVYLKKS